MNILTEARKQYKLHDKIVKTTKVGPDSALSYHIDAANHFYAAYNFARVGHECAAESRMISARNAAKKATAQERAELRDEKKKFK